MASMAANRQTPRLQGGDVGGLGTAGWRTNDDKIGTTQQRNGETRRRNLSSGVGTARVEQQLSGGHGRSRPVGKAKGWEYMLFS
jgi:hypothetical protein